MYAATDKSGRPACEVMRSVNMGYGQCNIMEERGEVR